MNVCFVANDLKSFNVLKNTWKYIRQKFEGSDDHHAFFYFATTQDIVLPNQQSHYNWDASSDIADRDDLVVIESLGGISIPKPDWLIVSRERWQPEQNIMAEMLQKFGTKIGVIEVNSHIWNSIETWMELHSRNNYPQSECTAFFEHSEHTAFMRSVVYPPNAQKSVIVGNPRHDNVKALYTADDMTRVRQKYDLDNKKLIMVCSMINTGRIEFLDTLKHLVENVDKKKYVVVFSPYPGEPRNERFKHQFQKDQHIDYVNGSFDVNISFDENDTYAIMDSADCILSQINSMYYLGVTFGKPIVCLNSVVPIFSYMMQPERYVNELKAGIEDSALFWCHVHGFKNPQEWETFVRTTMYDANTTVLEKMTQEADKLYSEFEKYALLYDYDLNFLKKIETDDGRAEVLANQNKLIPLFDGFHDGLASERIYQHLVEQEVMA